MDTIFRGVLLVFGVVVVGISLGHIVLGPAVIPGSVPVNATMDSEERFFAVFFLAYGAAILWCLKEWRTRQREIRALMAVFFLGGLARLVSIAAVGLPHPFFIAMTIIELVLPPCMVWLGGRAVRGRTAG